jgi:hypothetical protein
MSKYSWVKPTKQLAVLTNQSITKEGRMEVEYQPFIRTLPHALVPSGLCIPVPTTLLASVHLVH